MQYEKFIAHVQTCMERMVKQEYQVELHNVIKNNDVEQCGIVLMKEGERVSPTIYLHSYYERYLQGDSIPKLCKEILELRVTTMKDNAIDEVTDTMELHEWEDKIIYRLVNLKQNQKRLLKAPFIQFMDLAITFHCLVRNNEQGIGSFMITKQLMNSWGITARNLYQLACQNTPKYFPSTIRRMEDVLEELVTVSAVTEKEKETQRQQTTLESEYAMYILSNDNGINGASAILYPDVIDVFARQINSNLYILPSSIHEVILIPYQEDLEQSQLIQMVKEVNETQVEREEVLSYNVYLYDRTLRKLIIC